MDDFVENIRKFLRKGLWPIRVHKGSRPEITDSFVFSDNSGEEYHTPMIKEERCILVADIVGYSRKIMGEQLILVEIMNMLFEKTMIDLKNIKNDSSPQWEKWSLYKGTGDGAIFVFGQSCNPKSVCDALKFATWFMTNVIKYNKNPLSNDLTNPILRMTLSYGKIYETVDLEGNVDIIGDAINLASRLSSAKEVKKGGIFITGDIYHNLQINRAMYYVNGDKSIPSSGELSDSVIGKRPDVNNFLYITRKGLFETKDRFIEAYGISGRLGGNDIVS